MSIGRESSEQTFVLDLSGVSQNKAAEQHAVGRGEVPELVGADLRIDGALRVFPGMRRIARLGIGVRDWQDSAEENLFSITSTETEKVRECHAVSLGVGAEGVIRGWVFRTYDGSDSRFYFQFWDPIGLIDADSLPATPSTNVWRYHLLSTVSGEQPSWSAVPYGRLLYLYVRGQATLRWFTTSGNGIKLETAGPGARPSAPTVDLTFQSYDSLFNGGNGSERPYTEFPYYTSGSPWDPDAVIDYEADDTLGPGAIGFAYRLRNTVTGLASRLSEVTTLSYEDFVERVPYRAVQQWDPNSSSFETVMEYRSVGVRQKGTFSVTGIDLSDWNQIEVYRTIKITAPGAEVAGTIYHLEKVETVSSTSYTYDEFISDIALSIQDRYDNSLEFLAAPPKGGTAYNYEGMVFVSDTEDDSTSSFTFNAGEVRYTSSFEEMPELFPLDHYYLPDHRDDEIIRFVATDSTLLGFSESRIYEAFFGAGVVVLQPSLKGYGICGRHAAVEFGSGALFVTRRGVKLFRSSGELTSINALDRLIKDEWASSLSGLICAQDAVAGVVFILNPIEQEIACLWEDTRKVSELHHMPFVFVTSGTDPTSSERSCRAMFVTESGWVCVMDAAREKVFAEHSTQDGVSYVSAAGHDGDHYFTVTATPGDNAVQLTTVTGSNLSAAMTDVRDLWLYFPAINEWYQIDRGTVSGQVLSVTTKTDMSSAAQELGATVMLDPMEFRVRCWPVGTTPADKTGVGTVSPFTEKYVHSMGCYWDRVSGFGVTQSPKFRMVVVGGLEDDELARTNDTRSVVGEGSSEYYARKLEGSVRGGLLLPELQLVSVDLEFSLIALSVRATLGAHDPGTSS